MGRTQENREAVQVYFLVEHNQKKEGLPSSFATGMSAPAPALGGGFSGSGGGGMFKQQPAASSSVGSSAPSGGIGGFGGTGGIKSSQPPLASPGTSTSGMFKSNPISQPIIQNPSPLKSYKDVKMSQKQPPKQDKDSAELKQKLSEHEPI